MPIQRRSLPDLSPQDVARFWAKVKMLPSGCWEWQAKIVGKGYGSFHVSENKKERSCLAHRTVYKIYYQIDPVEMDVCHTCDNPCCVNPFHLFLGDNQANVDDKVAKGRTYCGEKHYAKTNPERLARGERQGAAKLTAKAVIAIRRKFAGGGVTFTALGAEYGVHRATIRKVIDRTQWAHI